MCVCAIGRMVSGAGAELTAAGVAQTHLRVENMPLTLSLLCSPDEEDDDVRGACCCGAESEMPPANTRQSKQAVRRKEGGGGCGGEGERGRRARYTRARMCILLRPRTRGRSRYGGQRWWLRVVLLVKVDLHHPWRYKVFKVVVRRW